MSSKSLELVKEEWIIMGRYEDGGAFLNIVLKKSDNQYKIYLISSCEEVVMTTWIFLHRNNYKKAHILKNKSSVRA